MRTIASIFVVTFVISFASVTRAQEPDDFLNLEVHIDVSEKAARVLSQIDVLLDRERWQEAAELINSAVRDFPDQIVPSDPTRGRVYVPMRVMLHERASRMPKAALEALRVIIDPVAANLQRQYETSKDKAHLERIVNEFPLSSRGDVAIDLLGDEYFRRGWYARASQLWFRILPDWKLAGEKQPANGKPVPPPADQEKPADPLAGNDPAPDPAKMVRINQWKFPASTTHAPTVLGKWIIAQRMVGANKNVEAGLEVVRQQFAETEVTIGGRKGKAYQLLRTLVESDQLEPGREDGSWSTYAGNVARNKIAAKPIEVADIEKQWSLADGFNNPSFTSRSDVQRSFPISSGGKIAVQSLSGVKVCDPTGKDQVINLQTEDKYEMMGKPRFTLAANDGRLYTRSGYFRQQPGMRRFRLNITSTQSQLICFDLGTVKRSWEKSASSQGEYAVFEGPPALVDGRAYVALTKQDAMASSYVACLDAENGTVLWQRLVCEGQSHQNRNNGIANHGLVSVAEGIVYYLTNLGTVSAIDGESGRILWVHAYPRVRAGINATGSPRPDVSPCLVHAGYVLAAPLDNPALFCINSLTGELAWENQLVIHFLLGAKSDRVYLTNNRVIALDLETGSTQWRWPENTVNGAGRGLIAGDQLYWPTASEIHILDINRGAKARTSVPLLERFNLAGGNLAVHEDQLVMANNNSLVLFRSYSKQVEQLKIDIASNPKSAKLHFRLADMAESASQLELASTHFRQAFLLAQESDNDAKGKIKELARSGFVRVIDLRAQQATGTTLSQQLIDELKFSLELSDAKTQRGNRIVNVFKLLEKHKKYAELAEVTHQWLKDSSNQESMVPSLDDSTLSYLGNQLVNQYVAEQTNPEFLTRFKELTEQTKPDASYSAEQLWRYPSKLLERAENAQKSGLFRDEMKYWRQLLSTVNLPADLQAKATQRIQFLTEFTASRWSNLESISSVKNQPVKIISRSVRKVDSSRLFPLAIDRVTRQNYQQAWPISMPAPISESSTTVLAEPVLREHALPAEWLLLYDRGNLIFWDVDKGTPRWSVTCANKPTCVRSTDLGVVAVFADKIICFDPSDGTEHWTYETAQFLTTEQAQQVQATAQTVCIPVAQNLISLDAFTGTPRWKRTLSSPPIQTKVAGDRLVAVTNKELMILNSRSGDVLLREPIQRDAASFDVLANDDEVVFFRDVNVIAKRSIGKPSEGWSIPIPAALISNPRIDLLGEQIRLIIDGYYIMNLARDTGKTLGTWKIRPIPDRRGARHIFSNEQFLLTHDGLILTCQNKAGELQWRRTLPVEDSRWTVQFHDQLAVASLNLDEGLHLVTIDVAHGQLLQNLTLAGDAAGTDLFRSSKGVIALGKDRISKFLVDERLALIPTKNK